MPVFRAFSLFAVPAILPAYRALIIRKALAARGRTIESHRRVQRLHFNIRPATMQAACFTRGSVMYRFTRKVTIKTVAAVPAALQFCGEVAAHLNKTYGLSMKTGIEMFGHNRVYWFYDADSLDAIAQLNAKLMLDSPYWEMIEKARHLWLEGSAKDRIVKLLA